MKPNPSLHTLVPNGALGERAPEMTDLEDELRSLGATPLQSATFAGDPKRALACIDEARRRPNVTSKLGYALSLFRQGFEPAPQSVRQPQNQAGSWEMSDRELSRVEAEALKRADAWKASAGLAWVLRRDPGLRGESARLWKARAEAAK